MQGVQGEECSVCQLVPRKGNVSAGGARLSSEPSRSYASYNIFI